MAVVQNGNASAISYVTTDQLNTPRAVTDASGTVEWNWSSDPFGNGQPTGSLTYNLRFPGQYYDAETGHNYNYERDYDPATGRYVESDPIGVVGGTNSYTYTFDNPIALDDSSGLMAFPNIFNSAQRLFERWGGCNEKEIDYCIADCASRGKKFESCRARIIKITEIRNGQVVPRIIRKWPPSCSCEDPDSCPFRLPSPALNPATFPYTPPSIAPYLIP